MKLTLIAAIGRNRELGLHGDMPWKRSLKKDLKFFRQTTSGHPIVMGRRTFESLPGLLPGRNHLVITTSELAEQEHLKVYDSPESFLKDWKDQDVEVFGIGGGLIYQQLLPHADALLLTEIDQSFEADTWFPDFDPSDYSRQVLDEELDGGYLCRHVLYTRTDRPAQ